MTRSSASYQSRQTSSEPQSAAPSPDSRFVIARRTASRPRHSPPIGGAPATQYTTSAVNAAPTSSIRPAKSEAS